MPHPQTTSGHVRAILVLGLPLIGSHLAQVAIHSTDTLMLGWYAVDALAAATIAGAFYFCVFIVGSGFAWAVMPMVAAADAAGDDQQVRRVTRMALWISLVFATATMPLLWFSEDVLLSIGQESRVAELAQNYLRIAGWSIFPALVVMVLKSYLAALERTEIVFWVTALAAALNVPINYALIFGNFGMPELGIRGAAIASVSLQVLSLVVLIAYVRRETAKYELFARFWRADPEGLRRVFRLGWPIGLTNLAEVGLFAASSVMIGWLGALALAAHGIALQLASITFMVHIGLSNAATIRAGQAFGLNDEADLRKGGRTIIAMSMIFALLTVAVFLLFPTPLIGLFLAPDDPARPEILALGAVLLALAAAFQLGDAAQVMALGLLRGVQDTRVPMVWAAIAYWGVGAPAAYLLGFPLDLGAAGVWIGLVIGLFVAAVALMARFWRRSVHIAAPEGAAA
ncbi:MAG: MATE family efflux transporter [Pseudomonadota bacterium]